MAQSNEKITCIAVTLRIGHAVAGSLIRNLLGKPLFTEREHISHSTEAVMQAV